MISVLVFVFTFSPPDTYLFKINIIHVVPVGFWRFAVRNHFSESKYSIYSTYITPITSKKYTSKMKHHLLAFVGGGLMPAYATTEHSRLATISAGQEHRQVFHIHLNRLQLV
jgi:hypothetical protein